MTRPIMDKPSRKAVAAAVAVGALTVSNITSNRHLPLQAHVPWSLGLTGGLIAIARWAGHDWDDIGLGTAALAQGVGAGTAGAAAVAAGYGVMVGRHLGDDLLDDARISSLDSREAKWHLLLRIPISTVLAEEVAFRGVLPALLASPDKPGWVPAVASSLLFGIWHVLPSLNGVKANGTNPSRSVAKDVAATTMGGMVLMGLRSATGSLAAPMAVHLAANAFGFVFARRRGR